MARVIDYYAQNPPVRSQITHTQAVASITRTIAVNEKYDIKFINLIEAAAWLHDIGCPDAVRKYGNSLPVHQQCEGKRIVYEWLHETNPSEEWRPVVDSLTEEEKEWLCNVVGSHHQHETASKLHFEPLFEADLIVNLLEGYYKIENAQNYFNKMMLTESGKQLFRKIIFED